jgi:Gas vesicle synthesis protein GvpL/GvpF
VIWVYAVAERPDLPVPRRTGLAQAPLEGVPAGPLLAVVTRHDHVPAEPAPDAFWTHERVIERVMADRAVLPMRFNTVQRDDDALRAALAERQDALCAALEHVRGRVELGVRAIAAEGADATEAPATGREWLLRRLADGRRDERLAASIHEPLRALAVDHRPSAGTAPGEVLRAAYLVERGGLARFGAAVERLQRELPNVDVLCTGPWPPYSFVSAPKPAEVAP